ncbi:MAG: hypothetical protein U0L52_10365, partial [Bacteroidaceae bacterium]|nr:hypothetical protein [Bacteroidaceae bacterium]
MYATPADRTALFCARLLALEYQYRFCPFKVYSVCFALVPLTFDLDCYILFSEHGLTSFLCVSQLQLEVFLAPFVYLVSVNPSTFREEPKNVAGVTKRAGGAKGRPPVSRLRVGAGGKAQGDFHRLAD